MIVAHPRELDAGAQGATSFPAFEAWSRSCSMALKILHPDDLDDPELLRRNRFTMLRYRSASAYECRDTFAPDILGACRDGLTLRQLEQYLAPLDPMVSRAAAFKLVLSGALYCPTLATQSLALRSVLVTQ